MITEEILEEIKRKFLIGSKFNSTYKHNNLYTGVLTIVEEPKYYNSLKTSIVVRTKEDGIRTLYSDGGYTAILQVDMCDILTKYPQGTIVNTFKRGTAIIEKSTPMRKDDGWYILTSTGWELVFRDKDSTFVEVLSEESKKIKFNKKLLLLCS